MSYPVDRRFARAAPPQPLRVRFEVQRQRVEGAEVIDLSLAGLGVWIPEGCIHLLEPNCILKELHFDRLQLPLMPHLGRLVFFTLKGQSARPGYLLAGIEYLHASQAFQEAMGQYLAPLLET
jgi:hypothetical protein